MSHDTTTVALDVTYDSEARPRKIDFFHNTFGMMKLEVDDGVATLDSKWDRLGDGCLKDGYDRWITTGDVLRSVHQLPFVESLEIEYPEGDERRGSEVTQSAQ